MDLGTLCIHFLSSTLMPQTLAELYYPVLGEKIKDFLKQGTLSIQVSYQKDCLSQSEAALRHIKATPFSKEGYRKATGCFLEKQHCGGTVHDERYRDEASKFFIS